MRSASIALFVALALFTAPVWAADQAESQNLCANALVARRGAVATLWARQFPSRALVRLIRAQYTPAVRRAMEARGERFMTMSEFSRSRWALMGVAERAMNDLDTQIKAVRLHDQDQNGIALIAPVIARNLEGSAAHRFLPDGTDLVGLSSVELSRELIAARARAKALWQAGRIDLYWVQNLIQGRNLQAQGVGAARWAPLWAKKIALGAALGLAAGGMYQLAAPAIEAGAGNYVHRMESSAEGFQDDLYEFVMQPFQGAAEFAE